MKETKHEEAFIEVVYNGEKIPVEYKEAVNLIQKGMNYDKISEKNALMTEELKELKQTYGGIEEIAKKLNISTRDLIDGLENEREKEDISAFSEENNIPYEYAKKFRDMENKIKSLEKEKEEYIPVMKRNEDLKEFKKIYPDVDERTLSPEIIKEWEESKRPLKDIYNEITLKKLLEEKNIENTNRENHNASSGSALGIPEREEEFTDELIRNMSDKEFNRNFSKILKQYKKGER